MALPTVSSVVTATSNNGGLPTGGYTATITGTNFSGAGQVTTSVKFGAFAATTFKVESATEIKATVPQSSSFAKGYLSGPVNVIVTTEAGSNTAAAENLFIYWPAQSFVKYRGRHYETVPFGTIKGAGASEVVSYLKAAGAETFSFNLLGDFTEPDYITVEVNAIEATGTPKLVTELFTSFDGGVSWVKLEATSATAEVNGVAKAVTNINTKEKPIGPLVRVEAKFGAAGGVAGTCTVVTDHA